MSWKSIKKTKSRSRPALVPLAKASQQKARRAERLSRAQRSIDGSNLMLNLSGAQPDRMRMRSMAEPLELLTAL